MTDYLDQYVLYINNPTEFVNQSRHINLTTSFYPNVMNKIIQRHSNQLAYIKEEILYTMQKQIYNCMRDKFPRLKYNLKWQLTNVFLLQLKCSNFIFIKLYGAGINLEINDNILPFSYAFVCIQYRRKNIPSYNAQYYRLILVTYLYAKKYMHLYKKYDVVNENSKLPLPVYRYIKSFLAIDAQTYKFLLLHEYLNYIYLGIMNSYYINPYHVFYPPKKYGFIFR